MTFKTTGHIFYAMAPKENIKERLLDQGIQLITESGYHGTGLKKILDTVKVPKGSFYNYFESKEAYVAQIIRRYSENTVRQVDAYLETTRDDPLTALKNIFAVAIHHLSETGNQGCLNGNLAGEIGGSVPACQAALQDGVRMWKDRLSGLIEKAQSAGQIRTDISPELLSDMLWDIWQGGLLRIRIDRDTTYLNEMITTILDKLLR